MPRANIRQVEAFNAMMKAGSVTKAAEALFVSQPAVSKLLQAFETTCDLKLFTRSKGRLVPTSEARQLYAETRRLDQGLRQIDDAARAIRELQRGEIAIVAFPGISMRLIPVTIGTMLQARPEVRLSLMTRSSRHVESTLLSMAADIGISMVPSKDPTLRCEPFAVLSMVCAIRRDHPLAAKPVISLADLDGERLVALGRDDLSYPVIEGAFQRAGLRMAPSAEVEMGDAACAMVAAGYGATIVPTLASFFPAHESVVFRPLAEPITMPIWAMTSAYQEPSHLAISMLDRIREAVEALEGGFRATA